MSIPEFINRINPLPRRRVGEGQSPVEVVEFDDEGHIVRHSTLDKLFLAGLIVMVATLSFGIGRLTAVSERGGVQILYENLDNNQETGNKIQASTNQPANVINAVKGGEVVVSKSGSKYHYSHCSGAKRIKEENKITFPSSSAAESAGYTLAANCKPR